MLNRQYKLDKYGDVLNSQDVHDILSIGYNKTYELLKTGAIKNFKIGRERKIPKRCLEDYINSMLEQADCCDT